MVDIIEILVHWHAGRSKSEIAQSLDVDRKTAGKYIAVAEAAGVAPGGPPLSEAEWDARVRAWFPELADTRLRQVTWPTIEPHQEFIRGQLKAGVTVTTIHQRLRDERGLAVSIASFRRYVAANVEETRRSQVKVLRPWPAEPGAEAQIDYGRLGRWLDPVAGKPVTVWAFVMVLACSRHMFVRPVTRLDQQAWSECHGGVHLGGVPARLVPDNLKTGAARPGEPGARRSTGPMPSWPRTTGSSRTRRGRSGPPTSSGLSCRCRMCGTRSGGAGSSPAWDRCRPGPSAGAPGSPGPGCAARWMAPRPCRCSRRWRKTRC